MQVDEVPAPAPSKVSTPVVQGSAGKKGSGKRSKTASTSSLTGITPASAPAAASPSPRRLTFTKAEAPAASPSSTRRLTFTKNETAPVVGTPLKQTLSLSSPSPAKGDTRRSSGRRKWTDSPKVDGLPKADATNKTPSTSMKESLLKQIQSRALQSMPAVDPVRTNDTHLAVHRACCIGTHGGSGHHLEDPGALQACRR